MRMYGLDLVPSLTKNSFHQTQIHRRNPSWECTASGFRNKNMGPHFVSRPKSELMPDARIQNTESAKR